MSSFSLNVRFSQAFGLYGYVALSVLAFATFPQYFLATGGVSDAFSYVAYASLAAFSWIAAHGVYESFFVKRGKDFRHSLAWLTAFPATVAVLYSVGTAFGSSSRLPEAVLVATNIAVFNHLCSRFQKVDGSGDAVYDRVSTFLLAAMAVAGTLSMAG